MRSPYLAALAPGAALAAGLARWLLQGSGNLYTQAARRMYLPDPDLGWRVVAGGPPWLGLEILGIMLAVLCAIVVGAFVVRRLERRGEARPVLRGVLMTLGLAPVAIPVWAFGGGFGPAGARDTLPMGAHAAAPTGEVSGGLDAPAGRWDVVASPGSAITARISAGGDEFDARFTGGLTGGWRAVPFRLVAPMAAEVSVDAASVDTGVAARSKSARTEYLHADQYPQLTWKLDHLLSTEQRGDQIAFRASGSIEVAGVTQPVEITGELHLLDDAARARLGVPTGPAILVEADFALVIADSGIAFAASDFDGDTIPVHVSLVLVHREGIAP